MKKTILAFAILLVNLSIYAQTNTLPASGYVGIGTGSPGAQLEIVGNMILRHLGTNLVNTSISDINFIPGGSFYTNPVAVIRASFTGDNWYGGSRLSFFTSPGPDITAVPSLERLTIASNGNIGVGTTDPRAPIHILKSSIPSTSVTMQEWSPVVAGYDLTLSNYNSPYGIDYRFTQFHAGTSIPVLTFRAGNVGIGTTEPDTKLAVNGTIHSKEVRVDLAGFPDYVFKHDYHLLSLAEVKTYIDQNHHLPEMPTEQEVSKDGINLGELNRLLVKKIEELTLYLIQQKEENDKQNELHKQQIVELKDQISKQSGNK